MAYTSVIPVRRLDRTVDYVQNKAKTTPKSLEEAVDYAANRDKTESACFETGLGCTTTSAFEDMRLNTLRWHKETGVQGYHLVQSFAEGEVTPELAHQIGVEFAEQLLHGKYQAIVTTHLNTKHYHNHIVWSAVSLEDGKKYHSNSKSYYTEVRALSDTLCQKYGLSIIETPESLRGKRQYEKWRAEENNQPTWRTAIRQDVDEARRLLDTYKEAALENLGVDETAQRTGFALLEPELTPHNGRIWLRLRVSDGIGRRQYLVKSIPQFLDAIEQGESVSYGKSLAFVHRWDAFAPDAQQLLRLLRRQVSARQAFEAEGTVRSAWDKGPAGGLPLTGEGLDALVELYAAEGVVGGYTLKEGLPVISLKVERRKGGVQLSCTPVLSGVQGLDYAYLLGETTLWRMQREECRRVLPVLDTFGGRSLFFTSADAAAFCSYVLPELGNRVNIVDPDRLLLNQIPLEPVVQFYLDAPDSFRIEAHAEFLYGEDKVTPFAPAPAGLLRDVRAESRAKRLLASYLKVS